MSNVINFIDLVWVDMLPLKGTKPRWVPQALLIDQSPYTWHTLVGFAESIKRACSIIIFRINFAIFRYYFLEKNDIRSFYFISYLIFKRYNFQEFDNVF